MLFVRKKDKINKHVVTHVYYLIFSLYLFCNLPHRKFAILISLKYSSLFLSTAPTFLAIINFCIYFSYFLLSFYEYIITLNLTHCQEYFYYFFIISINCNNPKTPKIGYIIFTKLEKPILEKITALTQINIAITL